MASAEFKHFGVPTSEKQENETYIAGAKVHVTDPDSHPYAVEFLRFEPDCPMPEAVQTRCHAAFRVESLEEALKGQNVIIEPFDATDTLRCAFITEGDAIIELMEMK
ncbi:MAG TPA: hypothetical protein VM492_15190 [Sumerlaeia bacterium]|nr:hypothetical protein [Sumerlaeia bacterium]